MRRSKTRIPKHKSNSLERSKESSRWSSKEKTIGSGRLRSSQSALKSNWRIKWRPWRARRKPISGSKINLELPRLKSRSPRQQIQNRRQLEMLLQRKIRKKKRRRKRSKKKLIQARIETTDCLPSQSKLNHQSANQQLQRKNRRKKFLKKSSKSLLW